MTAIMLNIYIGDELKTKTARSHEDIATLLKQYCGETKLACLDNIFTEIFFTDTEKNTSKNAEFILCDPKDKTFGQFAEYIYGISFARKYRVLTFYIVYEKDRVPGVHYRKLQKYVNKEAEHANEYNSSVSRGITPILKEYLSDDRWNNIRSEQYQIYSVQQQTGNLRLQNQEIKLFTNFQIQQLSICYLIDNDPTIVKYVDKQPIIRSSVQLHDTERFISAVQVDQLTKVPENVSNIYFYIKDHNGKEIILFPFDLLKVENKRYAKFKV